MSKKMSDLDMDIFASATEIVAARVNESDLDGKQIVALFKTVYSGIKNIVEAETSDATDQKPFVPIEDSVTPDYLICLEDGKKMKMLRRYLRTNFDMTPDEYREKWGLPADYPMTAPSYAKKRSSLAKDIGLGKGKKDK